MPLSYNEWIGEDSVLCLESRLVFLGLIDQNAANAGIHFESFEEKR